MRSRKPEQGVLLNPYKAMTLLDCWKECGRLRREMNAKIIAEQRKNMGFPKTLEEMTAQGYKHEGTANCRACNAPLEWWLTPKGKKIPMDHGTATAHWSTCPNAQDFRRPKAGRSTRETLDE